MLIDFRDESVEGSPFVDDSLTIILPNSEKLEIRISPNSLCIDALERLMNITPVDKSVIVIERTNHD